MFTYSIACASSLSHGSKTQPAIEGLLTNHYFSLQGKVLVIILKYPKFHIIIYTLQSIVVIFSALGTFTAQLY